MVNKEILNLQEVCELLNVSEKTMIKLLKEENIPATKIGREWRFSKQAVINWLGTGNSLEYSGTEEYLIDIYEKDTSKLLDLLDRVHERVSIIRKNKK